MEHAAFIHDTDVQGGADQLNIGKLVDLKFRKPQI